MTTSVKKNPLIGRRLGNYKIESLIAEGGMSSVYEGVHMLLGRRAAIKQLNPLLEQKEGVRERLKNEAVTLSRLKHPNIVGIYDYFECAEGTFIIEELIKGIPLNEYLKNESGPIPEPKAVKYMLQMLDAVGYMHSKGIIHRDIKPGNFIITPEGDIKMLDFGIAQIIGESPHLTQAGTKVGTALYMSPQQVKGQPLDRRTDIYSLGVTFFHMVTGQHPYGSRLSEYEIYNKIINEPMIEPMSIYKGVSAQMQEVIFKAVAKKPLDRYQDCGQIKRDLLLIAKNYETKEDSNTITQIFDLIPADKSKKDPIVKNAVMMGLVATFLIAVTVSVFTFSSQDQMHVIANTAFLYEGDSLSAKKVDNLNYGETLKIMTDKPSVTKDGTAWIEGVSTRGIKGFIRKDCVASAKVYQQINSMFVNKDAVEKTPDFFKTVLWRYFVENKFFKNSVSQWRVSSDSDSELEYDGICTGDFNGNGLTDYACAAYPRNSTGCKLLMFFDTGENIAIDSEDGIKIKTVLKGEQGGGWYLGNVYTRTAAGGGKYDVNKYEFLPSDGILIFNTETGTNTVCIFNADENKIHLTEQPK